MNEAVQVLVLRLALFGVEPKMRGDELWLVGHDDPATVLPAKLLAEVKTRAAEIYEFVRGKEARVA